MQKVRFIGLVKGSGKVFFVMTLSSKSEWEEGGLGLSKVVHGPLEREIDQLVKGLHVERKYSIVTESEGHAFWTA